mmetsp:Transcript_53650/g.85326  ORF Transcript_53650/g.85326 Transcript_53650/m.85326 type:complete len:458 (-) Transcript_53650:159-1532(-)|eukprot:CAMPEP_0169126018 /NCGR_PEP_ID=MMETSP1015-20121227/35211_1 /TAXON_ID=342587 /ORGANISM="Karlodinium micrum, Strain CCMP2283" /LENGTH=457 /DNA_ID=CAMNT_0009189627 /DNA_START=45 /DNA_END=1418 /DNA_ORIENTATION=-
MHDVLAALEDFHKKAASIFDRVESACGEVDGNLSALSDRLERAAARVEASRGSTRALSVRSARVLTAPRSAQRTRRLFDSDTLASLCSAAPLPEELGAGKFTPPTAKDAATALQTVVRCTQTPIPPGGAQRTLQSGLGKLLAAQDRLHSVSELFLFNSSEQMYKTDINGQRYVENLSAPDEVEVQPASLLMPWQRVQAGEANLQYDEDAHDPLMVDLRFVAKPAQRVQFKLPERLDGLGGPVADLTWREEDQRERETERPEWDQAKTLSRSRRGTQANSSALATPTPKARRDTRADLVAAAERLQTSASSQKAPSSAPPPPPAKKEQAKPTPAPPPPPSKTIPVKAPSKQAEPASPPPQAPALEAPTPTGEKGGKGGKGKAPPVPAKAKGDKGKGKAKGKDKGKGPGNNPGPPPPPAAAKAPSADKSAVLADIRAMPKLKKVARPVENKGLTLGKVK